MKKLLMKSLLFCIFASDVFLVYSDENIEPQNQNLQDSQATSTRGINLNNYPISIFTPQTQQFAPNISNVSKAVTGPTGATGPALPCLFNLAMLRRTLTGISGPTGLNPDDIVMFDTGLFDEITSNPIGSPSSAIPAESLTIPFDGYYLIAFSYAGNQSTINPAEFEFYATFNLLVNGSVAQTFTLSTFGIRQTWQQIIWLTGGDVVSFKAASFVSLFPIPTGTLIGGIDNFIFTINWIGPCLTPT